MSLRFSEKEAKAMGILSKKDAQRTKKNKSLITLIKNGSDLFHGLTQKLYAVKFSVDKPVNEASALLDLKA